jgi:hypothetical protein
MGEVHIQDHLLQIVKNGQIPHLTTLAKIEKTKTIVSRRDSSKAAKNIPCSDQSHHHTC